MGKVKARIKGRAERPENRNSKVTPPRRRLGGRVKGRVLLEKDGGGQGPL